MRNYQFLMLTLLSLHFFHSRGFSEGYHNTPVNSDNARATEERKPIDWKGSKILDAESIRQLYLKDFNYISPFPTLELLKQDRLNIRDLGIAGTGGTGPNSLPGCPLMQLDASKLKEYENFETYIEALRQEKEKTILASNQNFFNKTVNRCRQIHFLFYCPNGVATVDILCVKRGTEDALKVDLATQCNVLKSNQANLSVDQFLQTWELLDCVNNLNFIDGLKTKISVDGFTHERLAK